ncbi:hypothetical protein GOV06_02795 [Candidatus Woesearchaeota archaeon]|nr:hypothetical protein [Candidatus Woesearchaeota archaeon]
MGVFSTESIDGFVAEGIADALQKLSKDVGTYLSVMKLFSTRHLNP